MLSFGGSSGGYGSSGAIPSSFSGSGTPMRQAIARRTVFRPKARPAPRQAKPAPAPSYSPPPVSSNSYGSYSGGTSSYSGGGGAPSSPPSNDRSGRMERTGREPAAPPPPPPPPSIKEFLSSNASYQNTIDELRAALESFREQNFESRGDVKEDFRTAVERMAQERVKALEQMEEDFASRGLLNSGLYGDAMSDYQKGYDDRYGDLTRDRAETLGDLVSDMRSQRDVHRTQRSDARLRALRERATKYGLK